MTVDGTPEPRRLSSARLAPLRHKSFAMYLAGWATTRFGKGVEETALLWVAYELTNSPAMLGLLGLFRAVPSILLGPIAGAVADRIDQRKILFVTQSLGGLASLTAGILIGTGWIEVWQLG